MLACISGSVIGELPSIPLTIDPGNEIRLNHVILAIAEVDAATRDHDLPCGRQSLMLKYFSQFPVRAQGFFLIGAFQQPVERRLVSHGDAHQIATTNSMSKYARSFIFCIMSVVTSRVAVHSYCERTWLE